MNVLTINYRVVPGRRRCFASYSISGQTNTNNGMVLLYYYYVGAARMDRREDSMQQIDGAVDGDDTLPLQETNVQY